MLLDQAALKLAPGYPVFTADATSGHPLVDVFGLSAPVHPDATVQHHCAKYPVILGIPALILIFDVELSTYTVCGYFVSCSRIHCRALTSIKSKPPVPIRP